MALQGSVTAVEPQKRRGGQRSNVYLDGTYAFSLDADVAAELRVGDDLLSERTAELLERDQIREALDAALGFLGHRPRSETEVRRRLAREQLAPTVLDRVVTRLRELGLIDDASFARYWVEQRQTFRPKGARALRGELRARGVAADLVSAVVDEVADGADDAAFRAAEKRARQLSSLDEREFKARLGPFLARRGFDWAATRTAIDRLWSYLHPTP